MKSHFPGPWDVGDCMYYPRPLEIWPAKGRRGWLPAYAPIAKVIGDKRIFNEATRVATAKLISASPDLLDALEDCVAALRLAGGEAHPATVKALAAIAKATGEVK